MKKVLCLIDNLGSGGAQRQLVNLAIILKNSGYYVDFAVYGKKDFYTHILASNDISVNMIASKNYLDRIFSSRKFIRKGGYDVVITFLETPNFLGCFAKMGGGKFKLITNELSSKKSTFQGIRGKIYNYFERYSKFKVCNSYNALNLWKENYPKYGNKLHVIYNPVILNGYEPKGHEYKSNGKLNIVVPASYQSLKNPLGVIDALKLLDKGILDSLHIDWYGREEVTSGNTEIYDKAIKEINDNNLGDYITLHGETKDIYNIMNNADMVGLFSTVEGLPNVICEGMMIKKPIIMTKVSDYNILVENNGILCEPDSLSIKEALEKALSLKVEELEKMGEISYSKAKELFSIDVIKEQWINLIEN